MDAFLSFLIVIFSIAATFAFLVLCGLIVSLIHPEIIPRVKSFIFDKRPPKPAIKPENKPKTIKEAEASYLHLSTPIPKEIKKLSPEVKRLINNDQITLQWMRRESVAEFLRLHCVQDGGYLPFSEVYDLYLSWCDDIGLAVVASRFSFTKYARKSGFRFRPDRLRVDGQQERVLLGIGWNQKTRQIL